MQVIQGVHAIISVFQVNAITANTAAVTANTAAQLATGFFPFFARGGIVPHAANGYFVGGGRFSGDTTPIMANAGELVLNRAQQGNLAAQLDGGAMNGVMLDTVITAEEIRLVLNNNGLRTGRGEYVQTR